MPFTTSQVGKLLNFVTDAEPIISLGVNGPQYGPTELGRVKVCVRWLDVQDIGLEIRVEGQQPFEVTVSAQNEPAIYEQVCAAVQGLVEFKELVEGQIAKHVTEAQTATK